MAPASGACPGAIAGSSGLVMRSKVTMISRLVQADRI